MPNPTAGAAAPFESPESVESTTSYDLSDMVDTAVRRISSYAGRSAGQHIAAHIRMCRTRDTLLQMERQVVDAYAADEFGRIMRAIEGTDQSFAAMGDAARAEMGNRA